MGRRDQAAIGVMIFTAARAGAVAKLRLKHFAHDGTQWTLRFDEKGGKSREIPVRHDLERFLLDDIADARLKGAPGTRLCSAALTTQAASSRPTR